MRKVVCFVFFSFLLSPFFPTLSSPLVATWPKIFIHFCSPLSPLLCPPPFPPRSRASTATTKARQYICLSTSRRAECRRTCVSGATSISWEKVWENSSLAKKKSLVSCLFYTFVLFLCLFFSTSKVHCFSRYFFLWLLLPSFPFLLFILPYLLHAFFVSFLDRAFHESRECVAMTTNEDDLPLYSCPLCTSGTSVAGDALNAPNRQETAMTQQQLIDHVREAHSQDNTPVVGVREEEGTRNKTRERAKERRGREERR